MEGLDSNLGFVGPAVFVAANQLCHCSSKVATDDRQTFGWGSVPELYKNRWGAHTLSFIALFTIYSQKVEQPKCPSVDECGIYPYRNIIEP